MSTGMPRPLSSTEHEPSLYKIDVDRRWRGRPALRRRRCRPLSYTSWCRPRSDGVADVHARALADRFEALEDLDLFACVILAFRPSFVPFRRRTFAGAAFRISVEQNVQVAQARSRTGGRLEAVRVDPRFEQHVGTGQIARSRRVDRRFGASACAPGAARRHQRASNAARTRRTPPRSDRDERGTSSGKPSHGASKRMRAAAARALLGAGRPAGTHGAAAGGATSAPHVAKGLPPAAAWARWRRSTTSRKRASASSRWPPRGAVAGAASPGAGLAGNAARVDARLAARPESAAARRRLGDAGRAALAGCLARETTAGGSRHSSAR